MHDAELELGQDIAEQRKQSPIILIHYVGQVYGKRTPRRTRRVEVDRIFTGVASRKKDPCLGLGQLVLDESGDSPEDQSQGL